MPMCSEQNPFGSKLFHIENFLPSNVAEKLAKFLTGLPESHWTLSSSHDDALMYNHEHGSGTTDHLFSACEGTLIDSHSTLSATEHETIMDKLFTILSAGITKAVHCSRHNKFIFQCGRYTSGHFIEPHDDAATKDINGVTYHRSLAFILYLSKDWSLDKGGLFVDHGSIPSRPLIPKFNSLVAFEVPRLHQVTAVDKLCGDKRFSIFGWSLVLPTCSGSSRGSTSRKKNHKVKKLKKKHGKQQILNLVQKGTINE